MSKNYTSMKINIIVDNPNSWFFIKVKRLIIGIKEMGHQCDLYSKYDDIPDNSDISFFLSCEKYISTEIRKKSINNIVIHASDLPKGRGMSPMTQQILEGKNIIPITLFEVSNEFDAGDFYLKDNIIIGEEELVDEWREKLYKGIKKLALKFIKDIKILKPIKQEGFTLMTPFRHRTPKDSKLDIDKSIREQFKLLRVVDNERYPAFFVHNNHKYILKIYREND